MSAPAVKMARAARRSIMIVDDHPVITRGLAGLIDAEPDLSVSTMEASPSAALDAAGRTHPDLVIVDVELLDADGLELTAELRLRYPAIRVLVFSSHEESLYAVRALRVGASGYFSTREPGEVLLAAIRCALAGETWMSDGLRRELAARYVRGRTIEADSPLDTLSVRELHVFRLIGEGRTTRQVAQVLSRSVKTVESHIEHIKNKLTIRTAAELVHRATRWVETGRST